MTLQPSQYSSDANLVARQRLWSFQQPPFDLLGWVVGLTGAVAGTRLVDVGCGNGGYLDRLRSLGAVVTGCDLSMGMLRVAPGPGLVHADAQCLPVRSSSADAVLAAHMLYHVPDRRAAVAEMRRVLRPGGKCVVVTCHRSGRPGCGRLRRERRGRLRARSELLLG